MKGFGLWVGIVLLCFTLLIDGVNAEKSTRIVGGSRTGRAFPWMVSLQRYGRHFCGGSLVAPNLVLTAAHCVEDGRKPYAVVLGPYDLTNVDNEVGVQQRSGSLSFEIVEHPEYRGFFWFDVAFVVVDPPFVVSSPLDLIQLSESVEDEDPSLSDVYVSGWGVTSYGSGKVEEELRWVNVPLVTLDKCREQYGEYLIREFNICAGSPGKDSCSGDSGGPLFRLSSSGVATQIGIVSWGRGCGSYYGVYSGVRGLADFVKGVIVSHGVQVEGSDLLIAYKKIEGICSGLKKRKCKRKRDSCVFVRKQCHAEPLEEMMDAQYCGIITRRKWCEMSQHEDRCHWESNACVKNPTPVPTLAPSLSPTVSRCRTYKNDEEACKNDWSCQWNGSEVRPKRKRCTRRKDPDQESRTIESQQDNRSARLAILPAILAGCFLFVGAPAGLYLKRLSRRASNSTRSSSDNP